MLQSIVSALFVTTNVCVVLCRRVVVRSPRCLKTCAHSWWCRQVGWHCVLAVVCGCVSWAPYGEGFRLGRQAAWRPRCNHGGVVKTFDGTVYSAIASRLRVTWALCVGFELGRQD